MPSEEVLTALESLHRELEKLEPAIKHVETAQQITQTVKGIPQKHVELLEELKDSDTKHKGELKDLFTNELIGITDENKKISKTTTEIQLQVKTEQELLSKLKDTIQEYYKRIENVNFPERLDKLDANIAGIMSAIQAVQSRLDGLERNIIDRLKDILDNQKEANSRILTNITSSSKKQQFSNYVTWLIIIISAFAVIIALKEILNR